MKGCTYNLCMSVKSFCDLSVEQGRLFMTHLVKALVLVDTAYLRRHTNAPLLYHSGIYYRRDGDIETQWLDIPAVLARGYADCKALSAWRIAELNVRGEYAVPKIDYYPSTGYHTLLLRSGSVEEDPSARLGMI